ncbi:MAG: macro domain-containing protein [Bacteroidota bacterium]|nr:macro domain-containing protein [Bacteroidota bacterium]MDP4230585.1 macro domain-containing protein [Bacteroidota bacterium]MDP4237660.1 macro domain-containing protein [Bacteroidota bacterium]
MRNAAVSLGNVKVELKIGNIALLDTDAIVNASNEYLNLGSGVAGAIREAGGAAIQNECNNIGFCPVGSAVMTGGGTLHAKYVIHAVGPMYGEGNENAKLYSAVRTAITLADKKGLSSIALPALSAGFFHFPLNECAKVIVNSIKETAPTLKSVDHIIICVRDDRKFDAFEKELVAEVPNPASL